MVGWAAEELAGIEDDMRWAGASAAEIADVRGRYAREVEPDVFVVDPENGTAVRLFILLHTQWRKVGLGGLQRALIVPIGLDYGVIEPTARLAGLTLAEGDFERIRVMEAEAMKAWAEELERAA